MKILFITNSSESGGEATFLNDLAIKFSKLGHSVEIFSFLRKRNTMRTTDSEVRMTFMNPFCVFGKPIPSIFDLVEIFKKAKNVDCVIHFSFNIHSVFFLFASYLANKNNLTSFNTDFIGRIRIMTYPVRKLIKFIVINFSVFFSKIVIFITNSQKEDYRKLCFLKKKFDLKSKVVFYTIRYLTESHESFKKDGFLRVLFIGRLTIDKGFDDLLCVMDKMKNKKIIFNIIGDGPLRNDSRKNKNVHYYGEINNKEVEEVIKQNDVFILPSYSEAFGISILEAMSKGLIVLVSNLPNISDVLKNGVNCFYFKPGDIEEIEKIILLISDMKYEDFRKISDENIRFIDNSKDLIPVFEDLIKLPI